MRGNATRYDKILLLTDLTEKSQAALGYARAMAKYYDSHLVLLHVLPPAEPLFPSLGTQGWRRSRGHSCPKSPEGDRESVARRRHKRSGPLMPWQGRQQDDSASISEICGLTSSFRVADGSQIYVVRSLGRLPRVSFDPPRGRFLPCLPA